jgi:hypothetical protein
MYEDTIFIFYFWETWSYAWKQNILFLYFYIFLWKLGILIPDMYLYSIKIQINIDQNAVKYTRKSQILFWKYFLNLLIFFGAGSSSARVAGLDPAVLSGSLAQPSDPAA